MIRTLRRKNYGFAFVFSQAYRVLDHSLKTVMPVVDNLYNKDFGSFHKLQTEWLSDFKEFVNVFQAMLMKSRPQKTE